MAFVGKQYLDYVGLTDYDGRIKDWVRRLNTASSAELQAAIDALEEKVGDENVDERIAQAIANVIDSAPQTFDTLKEIADWIEEHGEAAAALVESVAALGEQISAVDNKVDELAASFTPISGAYIEALFLEPVTYDSSKTITEQVEALQSNEKLVIDAAQNSVISEDVTINNDCVIEAQDVEFTGTITVTEGTSATVIGATFSGEVVVQ